MDAVRKSYELVLLDEKQLSISAIALRNKITLLLQRKIDQLQQDQTKMQATGEDGPEHDQQISEI